MFVVVFISILYLWPRPLWKYMKTRMCLIMNNLFKKHEGYIRNKALSKLNLLAERSWQVLSPSHTCNVKRLAPGSSPPKTCFLVLFTLIAGILFALFCKLLNISFGSTCFFFWYFFYTVRPCHVHSNLKLSETI